MPDKMEEVSIVIPREDVKHLKNYVFYILLFS